MPTFASGLACCLDRGPLRGRCVDTSGARRPEQETGGRSLFALERAHASSPALRHLSRRIAARATAASPSSEEAPPCSSRTFLTPQAAPGLAAGRPGQDRPSSPSPPAREPATTSALLAFRGREPSAHARFRLTAARRAAAEPDGHLSTTGRLRRAYKKGGWGGKGGVGRRLPHSRVLAPSSLGPLFASQHGHHQPPPLRPVVGQQRRHQEARARARAQGARRRALARGVRPQGRRGCECGFLPRGAGALVTPDLDAYRG